VGQLVERARRLRGHSRAAGHRRRRARYPDPACPAVTDDGTTVTITGDCADTEGHAWTGVATVVRSSSGGHSVANRRAFQISALIAGGVTTTVTYNGTVASYDTPTG
jgi:hypothetical protein